MCQMLNRSAVSLEKSKLMLDKYKENHESAYLDSACYDAQQAIEFLLKGILLEYGIYFGNGGLPKNLGHDLQFIITKIEELDIRFDKIEDLNTLATTITSWEETGRYGSGIRTSINTVQRVHNIYDSILKSFLEVQEKNQLDNPLNDTVSE